LPEEYAASTIAREPVASTRSVRWWRMSASVPATDTRDIDWMRSGGAPASCAASCITRADSPLERTARGCGAITIALRVFAAISALKSTVEVGFVTGTRPAITPTGSAIVITRRTVSFSITPTVRSSLKPS
jgi:hypothetical protein